MMQINKGVLLVVAGGMHETESSTSKKLPLALIIFTSLGP
jgi:hypothetical protein